MERSESPGSRFFPEPARFVDLLEQIVSERYRASAGNSLFCGECNDGIMSFIRVDFTISTQAEDADVQTFRIPGDADVVMGWFRDLRGSTDRWWCGESTCSCDCRRAAWGLRVDQYNNDKKNAGKRPMVIPPLYSDIVITNPPPMRRSSRAAYMNAMAFDRMLTEHFKGGAQ